MHGRAGVLVITGVTAADAGRYVCLANNTAGSERVELELAVVGSLSAHLTPQQLTVDLERSAELHCNVAGHPTPTITWAKDGVPLRDAASYRYATMSQFLSSTDNCSTFKTKILYH